MIDLQFLLGISTGACLSYAFNRWSYVFTTTRQTKFRCEDCHSSIYQPYYMVKDEVWLRAMPTSNGYLCLKCLNTRLIDKDYRLTLSDFTRCGANEELFQIAQIVSNGLR